MIILKDIQEVVGLYWTQRLFKFQRCHSIIIYLRDEKMTLPSFLKTVDLKHLLKALNATHRAHPLPFYLLKTPKAPSAPPRPHYLSLSRTLSNAALLSHPHKFSVWSPHHLRRLQNSGINDLENRVLLSNPFKSEQFIVQALASSIKSMAISSADEFFKIQKIKESHPKLKNRRLHYYWTFSNEPEELESVKQMKDAVKSVVFDLSEIRSVSRIEELTAKIIEVGCSLENVVCSGGLDDIDDLRRWSLRGSSERKNKVNKAVELRGVSDVDSYILAAKSKGRGALGIDSAAQQLIDVKNCAKDSVMVQTEKGEWLISKIVQFPLDEETYIYEMEAKAENKGFEVQQPSAV